MDMDKVYEKKYLKYKQKYLNLKYSLKGSGPEEEREAEAEIRKKRDECYKKCIMPKEPVTMTSGPEVQAKWDEWHQCYAKCLEETPFTEAEKRVRERIKPIMGAKVKAEAVAATAAIKPAAVAATAAIKPAAKALS